MTLTTKEKKAKKKRIARAKAKTKAEAEAKARRLRAQGKRVEVRKDPHTGLWIVYEIIFLGVALSLLGGLFRPPPA